ncbi:MAG: carboxypeptidase-like regulatory domain-containing protein [Planctomycetota bacterium]
MNPRVFLVIFMFFCTGIVIYVTTRDDDSPPNPVDPTPEVPLTVTRGTVLDRLGRPVAGVTVKAIDLPHAVRGRTQTMTSRTGAFSLELPEEYEPRVSFEKNGYAAQHRTLVPTLGEEEPGYVLERAIDIGGRVVDEEGRPVARAEVTLQRESGERWNTTTSEDGVYTASVPPGPLFISVHSPRYADREWVRHLVARSPDSSEPVPTVTLARGTTARFRVVEGSRPLSSVAIHVRTDAGDRETVVTDRAGIASVTGLGGRRLWTAAVRSGFAVALDERVLELDGGTDLEEQIVRLEPAMPYSLGVTVSGGASVERAHVRLEWRGMVLAEGPLDRPNPRAIAGPGATLTLAVTSPGFPEHRQPLAVSEPDTAIDIPLQPGVRLSGVVVRGDGKPIAGATVRFQSGRNHGQPGQLGSTWQRTTAEGRFRSPLLPAGTISVRAEHPDHGAWSKVVDVAAGEAENREEDLGEVTLEK